MALDMAKYRRIFLEEATDHLGEISRALLDLEKEMGNAGAIDTIFRMAHSIKSMAASLGYDPVAELSHRMEDRMEGVRSEGRVRDPGELSLLFRALEALESMVATVADDAPLEPASPELLAALAAAADPAPGPAADPAITQPGPAADPAITAPGPAVSPASAPSGDVPKKASS
jgi:two-component system chemotaxis sensor kinase CheA